VKQNGHKKKIATESHVDGQRGAAKGDENILQAPSAKAAASSCNRSPL
jgi:hypothetical protein